MISSTGDNDDVGTKPPQFDGCPHCHGTGFITATPPHIGNSDQAVILENPQTKQKVNLAWMTQFAYQAGPCNACAGSGENKIKPLPDDRLCEDMVFLQFMADHWQDAGAVKKQIEEARKDIQKHLDATNQPTLRGLRVILQGVGLNPIQANLVVDAIAGYVNIAP
jgi:hypothetical protein